MSQESFKVKKSLVLSPSDEPASPQNGELYYDQTMGRFRRYENGAWKVILNNLGIGDDLGALTFKASVSETFSDPVTDILNTVDYSIGKTDSSLFNISKELIRIRYDASKTVAAGSNLTTINLSSAATFTVKVGDLVIYGSQVKRINTVNSQSSFIIESLNSAPTIGTQITISQGIYTKDLNNFSADGLAASQAFTSSINQVLVNYEDSSNLDDNIFDIGSSPVIGYSVSSDGTNYSNLTLRSTDVTGDTSILNLPTSGTNLYIRFVVNKTTGSGAVNLLNYKTFFHRDVAYEDGAVLNQAACFTDGAGTQLNCLAPSVVGGKTRITLTNFSIPVGVNSGTPNGAVKVTLNGQKIPRYVNNTLTPDAYYKEINAQTIELDSNYSLLNLFIEIIQDVAVVDNSETNSTGISQLQEIQAQGFQNFVNMQDTLIATAVTGTPAIGTFYSSIINRAPLVNLTQDLKPRMGIERVAVQQITQLQNEFGPNGEPVWSAVNDTVGRIRFVGQWTNTLDNYGSRAQSSASIADFIEVTFYGTGLNLLASVGVVGGADVRISVDGSSEGSNIFPGAQSIILAARSYPMNQIVSAVSGLSLGIYTVKLRNNSSNSFSFLGFEILNQSSTISVTPGISYINGKKITTNTQQSLTYNSSFESGILGSVGGRAVVYQKTDGSIAKAIQPVNTSIAYLNSADHSNEEIARTIHWREFGAGRSDDFSLVANGAAGATRAFTLDDGTTALVSSSVRATTISSSPEGIYQNANGDFITLTFIGTGIDLTYFDTAAGGNDSYTFQLDGGTAQAWPYTAGTNAGALKTLKIVSGLPYGTHTLKINRVTAITWSPCIVRFVIYQPKKPSLPSGAIELADYNVLANYSTSASAAVGYVAPGVMRKAISNREATYVGTWVAPTVDATNFDSGFNTNGATSGNTISYTFFGTGFEWRGYAGAAVVNNATLSIDGSSNLSSFTTNLIQTSTGATFTASTGLLAGTNAAANRLRIQVSGLALGLHTVKFTTNSAAGFYSDVLDIITPIHSYKANLNYDQQNTMMIGSNSLSDNRKTSAIKELTVQTKNIAQATGILNVSTTSTSYVPLPDMNLTHYNKTGKIKISYSVNLANNTGNSGVSIQLYIDGIYVSGRSGLTSVGGASQIDLSDIYVSNISPGVHIVQLYYIAGSGTTVTAYSRNLLVEEI